MSTLITTEQEMLAYMPNTFTTVEGENNLYEKCTVFLDQAEVLLEEMMVSPALLKTEEYITALPYGKWFVVLHALYLALPFLDLVLTANGFGIVNSSDVVPASKDRVDRLSDMLLKQRDNTLCALERELLPIVGWQESRQFKELTQTMYGELRNLYALSGNKETDLIDFYRKTKPALISLEKRLTDHCFGQEVMDSLRKSAMLGWIDNDNLRVSVARALVAEETRIFNDPKHRANMASLIDIIRKNPESFPEWATSDFGKYYENPVYYENKKEKGGYWW